MGRRRRQRARESVSRKCTNFGLLRFVGGAPIDSSPFFFLFCFCPTQTVGLVSGIGQGQASPLLLVHLVCGILRTLDAPILRLPQALVHTRDVLSSQSRTVRIRFSSRSMSWMLERMLCSNKRYNITLRFPLYPITSIQQKRSNNYLFFQLRYYYLHC